MKKISSRPNQIQKEEKKAEKVQKSSGITEEYKKKPVQPINKAQSKSLKHQRQSLKSDQSQSTLFKIPKPVLIQIFLFAISSGKEHLKLELLCKKGKEFIDKHTNIWLSLIIHKFPKALGKNLGTLKQRHDEGYFDDSADWKSLYVKEYIQYVTVSNEQNVKKLDALCKVNSAAQFFRKIKEANMRFVLKNGRSCVKVMMDKVKFFEQSLIFKLDYDSPPPRLHTLELTLYSKTFAFNAKDKSRILEGDLSILSNTQGMEIQLSGDTYTQYFIIPYAEIYSKLTNYTIKPLFDDFSSNFGKLNYTLFFDLHSLTNTLASHIVRNLDLHEENNVCQGVAEDLKYRIPKENFVFDWKSLAFSKKIQNVAVIDVTVFDEQGRLFLWTSQPGCLSFVEQNGNEGDGYSISVKENNFGLTAYFRDKGKSFLLSAISFEITCEHIQKLFLRHKNNRLK